MAKKITLLYFIPSFGTGGTERLIADLVTRLDPDRFRVSVCVQHRGAMGDTLTDRGYTVHVLTELRPRRSATPLGKLRSLTDRVASLRNLVEREHIDILHTHHLGPLLHAYLAGFRFRDWKWVHTEHIRPDVDTGYPRWLERAARLMFSAPDAVTGVSDAVGDYLRDRRRVTRERVKVIYNGVDVDRFAGPYDGSAKRQELGIPSKAWIIGLVASLRPQKNHALLLRAFAHLLPEVPEARLVLAGDGDSRSALETLADNLGVRDRIHFLGSRLDAPELFAMFDVYCLPSHYEGMPLTVFEAMAAGKPVVATSVVGIREVVSHEETGLLVPPDDPHALARSLLCIRREPNLGSTLVEAGRRYANRHARLEDMVDRYAALYEQLVKG